MNGGTSIYYVCLAVALALVLSRRLFRARLTAQTTLVVLWLLPFLFFFFLRNKDIRFLAPVLPAFAILCGALLDAAADGPRWKTVCAFLALLFPALAFFDNSFGLLAFEHERSVGYANTYRRGRWPHEDILAFLYAHTGASQVMLGTDRAEFNADNFQLAAIVKRLPLTVTTSAYEKDPSALLAQLHSASVFLFEEGGEPESPFYNRYQKRLIQQVTSGGTFREIPNTFIAPDGGRVRMFQNPGIGPFQATGSHPAPCRVNFGGVIELNGFDVRENQSSWEVDLRWRCLRKPDRIWRCFLHVLDDNGQTVGQGDHWILNSDPRMLSWSPGDSVVERLRLTSPTQPRFRIGLFDLTSGERLKLAGPPSNGFVATGNGTAVITQYHK